MAGPCTEDSCSVTLTTDGGVLQADVNLSPVGGLVCAEDEGLAISTAPPSCGLMFGVNSSNQLEASLVLDSDGGLRCGADGLGVLLDPTPCNGLALSNAGLRYYEHEARLFISSGGTVSSGKAGVVVNPLGVVVNLDAFHASYGSSTQEITVRVSMSYTNNTCRNVRVKAGFGLGPIGFQVTNGWAVSVGMRNEVISPLLNTIETPGIFWDTTGGPQAGGQPLTAVMPPHAYHVYTTLTPGQSIQTFHSILLQTAVGGPVSPNPLKPNRATIYFGQEETLELWTQ